jgi:hypothetical protein
MNPALLFNYYKGHAVAAFSKHYVITLLDSQGKTVTKIKRDILRPEFSSKEIALRKKRIDRSIQIPDHIKARLKTALPEYKAFFGRILVSDAYVFVFLIPKKEEPDFWPVDLFTFDGSFVGTAMMDDVPIYLTSDFMYFKTRDEEGDPLVEKHRYTIIK